MSYGYVGDTSTSIKQQVKNAGVLSVSDVLDLEGKGQLGGSLELIEEQTVSGVSSIVFDDLKENIYNVHLLQCIGLYASTSTHINLRFSNDNGSTFESSNYQYAIQYVGTNGSNGEIKSTTGTDITNITSDNNNSTQAGGAYHYLYNLGNSSKYSFTTGQVMDGNTNVAGTFFTQLQSGVYAVAETINAFNLFATGATVTGTASLYGIAES